jgi:hypothetical protein
VTIQEKAKCFSAYLKKKKREIEGSFVVSHDWFNRLRNRVNLHNVNMNGEAESADTLTAE